MPAYNEEKNIGTVIEQWYPVVERIGGDSRLVILNDGSKDATYKKIQNYQKNHDRLIGIDKPNEGHGGTILRGYRYAVEKGADYIFQTDSDGQTLPEEFWQFWEKRQKCGLLIGYRQKREDGLSRIFVTRILRLVLFLIFGTWVKDANTPYRLMIRFYQHETDHKDRKTGICGLYPSAGQNLIQEGQKDEKKDRRIISGADCSSAPDSTFCVSPGRRCMDILDLVAACTVHGNGGNAGHRKAFRRL